jgi:hypothetical protein
LKDLEHSVSMFGGMPVHPSDSQLDEAWGPWTVRVPAGLAGGLAALLGSLGFFVVGFGVGSNCTDQFDCGRDTCAPCASSFSWVNAGAIGQWVLVIAVIVLLIVGLRRPLLRRIMAVGLWGVVPVSCAWIAVSTGVAQRSF